MSNWIGPTVKLLRNFAMHVLHNFFFGGVNINTTAFCLGRYSLLLLLKSYTTRPIMDAEGCSGLCQCRDRNFSYFSTARNHHPLWNPRPSPSSLNGPKIITRFPFVIWRIYKECRSLKFCTRPTQAGAIVMQIASGGKLRKQCDMIGLFLEGRGDIFSLQ